MVNQGVCLGHCLRIGTIIVAWKSMLIGLGLCFGLSAKFFDNVNNFEEKYKDIVGHQELDEHDIEAMPRIKIEVLMILAFYILGAILLVVVAICLIVGIYERNAKFMLPSMVYCGVGMTIFAFFTIYDACFNGPVDDIGLLLFQNIAYESMAAIVFAVIYFHYCRVKIANKTDNLNHQLIVHPVVMDTSPPMKHFENNIA